MTYLEIINPVYIYAPPFVLFGGARINTSNERNTLVNDLSILINELGNALYSAYEIKSLIKKTSNSIINKITPLEGFLDEKCRDYYLNDFLVKSVLNKLINTGKEQAILISDNIISGASFYFMQLLQKEHDIKLTMNLIKAIEKTSLILSLKNHKISQSLEENCLITRAEIIEYNNYFI